MPKAFDEEVQSRVEAFASEIASLLQGALVEVVQSALGSGERPRARAAAFARTATARRAKGVKRDPAELSALVDRLAQHIKKNPGQRIEQIGKAIGSPTKDLALPVKKLIAAKRISTKGERRATKYFPKG